MEGGQHIFFHQAVADNDSVFKIKAVVRHVGHKEIGSKGKLPVARARTVRQYLPSSNPIPLFYQGALEVTVLQKVGRICLRKYRSA